MFQKKTDNTFCMNELNHGECDKLYDQRYKLYDKDENLLNHEFRLISYKDVFLMHHIEPLLHQVRLATGRFCKPGKQPQNTCKLVHCVFLITLYV